MHGTGRSRQLDILFSVFPVLWILFSLVKVIPSALKLAAFIPSFKLDKPRKTLFNFERTSLAQ